VQIEVNVDDYPDRGLVARMVVDYQERLNILNSELIKQLTSALNDLIRKEDLRVLILTGRGERSFIGGADVNEMSELDKASAKNFITRLHEACAALRKIPVPVIARISGYCLGAGLEIAASCDLRIAADRSTFGMPEVNVGIPSVIEAAILPRLIGWGKAAELVYTGDTISAAEAVACGLIERAVPAGQLDAEVDRWTRAILRAGPRAIRLQKDLLREWERLPLDQAIERGIDVFAAAYETDEPRVFMQRFLTRRNRDG
jgi:enoyl-CoA hydratase